MPTDSPERTRGAHRLRRRLVLAAIVAVSVLGTVVPSVIAVADQGLDNWLARIVAEPDG